VIKEIVDFSKQLETSGIYERISENLKKIDRPIMVIPVSDDLNDILYDEIYFIFNRIEGENCFFEDDKPIKINASDKFNIRLKSINDEDEQWQEILKALQLYTRKLPTDAKGNKSIGGNKGTNSYHLLIFEGKVESGIFGVDRKEFENKISRTYEKEVIEKGMPDDLDKNEKKRYLELLDKVKDNSNLDKIWREIEELKNTFEYYNENKKNMELPFASIIVVFKLSRRFYEENNIYKKWYDKYMQKKIFKVDNPDVYYKANCSICGSKNVDTYLPDCFNNMDSGKPFLQHIDRKSSLNTAVCGTCALEIYKFQEYFLNRLGITLFPLFIHRGNRERTIHLFHQQEVIEKLSFHDIISEIYRETSTEELDFYLVFYNRQEGILFFDYITGFHYKIKSTDIFEIEAILDYYFFDNNLNKNYFNSKVKTENQQRDNLIYTYRQPVFDFVYRAKYGSLDRRILQDLYFATLGIHLRRLVSKDRFMKEGNLKKSLQHYLKLDNIFTGVLMDTIKKIQESQTIGSKESFAYYSGQIVYYLLSQSKSESRTHSLVEPFINATSFSALGIRIEELFNSYKHALSFNYGRFNTIFSSMWAFLYDHKEEPFTKDLKILFYAGYFNSEDNIFYKPGRKEEQPK